MSPINIKPGNVILFDSDEYRTPPSPIQRGIVIEVTESEITFQGEFKRKIDRCAGIYLTPRWLKSYGFNLPKDINGFTYEKGEYSIIWVGDGILQFLYKGKPLRNITFVHDLQNAYQEHSGEKLTITQNP